MSAHRKNPPRSVWAAPGPDESTLRKLFNRPDAAALDAVIGLKMFTRTTLAGGGRRVIAIDGKPVRGAPAPNRTAPHLVAAFDTTFGTVLGQLKVDAKTNEIPTARTLLGLFDLNHSVVTLDATHTQTQTAQTILDGGGHYVFTVKANTPTLRRELKELPWKDVPAHTSRVRRRGRLETRTIKVIEAPDWIDFPGIAQVAQLRRTVTSRGGKRDVEVVFLMTSASFTDAPPPILADWVRDHLGHRKPSALGR